MDKEIRVVELFAGVGGFRLGLENSSKDIFKTIWANQWEPGKNVQHAYDCYVSHFGESNNHVNANIAEVKQDIPEHDLLVGGFPCQDYSVASTKAKGLQGKKGVLWWEIKDILKRVRPSFILLENVDRLLRSPSTQRGRDFGIMLRTLNDLGYIVEWRVINAAEYGHAQKRRRVFIFAVHKNNKYYNTLSEKININDKIKENKNYPNDITFKKLNKEEWDCKFDVLTKNGFFADIFPVEYDYHQLRNNIIDITKDTYMDLSVVSDNFAAQFWNSGIAQNGIVMTTQTTPIEQKPTNLGEIIEQNIVDDLYVLDSHKERLEKFKYLKDAKKIKRVKEGYEYFYSEGAMGFPDSLDKPARTMLTSESSVNRSTHVILDPISNKLRLITPIEAERLNGFEDNWTNTGMPHRMRYFTMGNALVVPLITTMGDKIRQINEENNLK